MIYTIISAKNEENKIKDTLKMVLKTETDRILVVINGCTDDTYNQVNTMTDNKIQILYFNKPLGVDVPRAIGAYFAFIEGASTFIFVDGDMCGKISDNLDDIIRDVKYNSVDMGLTDCYPINSNNDSMARVLLAFREQLNREIGLFNKIGYSTPSHGPHGVSRRLIRKVGLSNIAIPPVALSLAASKGLNITVSTRIPDNLLESTIKDELHAEQITKTIIGDCIEALSVYKGDERTRGYDGIEFLGYHKNRRFDIMDTILNS